MKLVDATADDGISFLRTRSMLPSTIHRALMAPSRLFLSFLYETKTLSGGQNFNIAGSYSHGFKAVCNRISTHRISRCFQNQSIQGFKSSAPTGRTYDHTSELQKIRPTRTSETSYVKWSPVVANIDESPFDASRRPQARRPAEDFNEEPDDLILEDDEFAEYDLNRDAEFSDLPTGSSLIDGKSTITNSERKTFLRIFSEISSRSKSAVDPRDLQREVRRDLAISPEVAERRENAEQTLMSIMENAARRSPPPMKLDTMTEEQKMIALDAYPAILRDAAAKAMGLAEEPAPDAPATTPQQEDEEPWVWEEEEQESARAAFLKNLRKSEYERIETKLRAAATDIELWNVMEQEVFALVNKLGLAEEAAPTEEKKPRGRRKKTQTQEVTQRSKEEMTTSSRPQDEGWNLEIYGPLYPSFLLLGFRLLERAFARPSPLVNSIIPRVKSMGLMSQVLGASTALYNEQLRVMWYRNDDFLGVLELLNEMEQAGLEFDDETFYIVEDIDRMQHRVRKGANGVPLQLLWTLPEFAMGKFRYWREKIQASLVARAADYSQR